MNIQIQKLTPSSIEEILKLESHSAPEIPIYFKYDEEALKKLFENPDKAEVFGAFSGERLVGWASYRSGFGLEGSEEGEYAMSSLVVDNDFRRKGVGTQLFHKRLNILKDKPDMKRILATAYPKNIGIIILYLKNGFVISDYKKDLYGPGADRVYLEFVRG